MHADEGGLVVSGHCLVHKLVVAIAVRRDSGFELVDHLPYSPDLALYNFQLFPNMNKLLAGKKYQSDEEVISAVEGVLTYPS